MVVIAATNRWLADAPFFVGFGVALISPVPASFVRQLAEVHMASRIPDGTPLPMAAQPKAVSDYIAWCIDAYEALFLPFIPAAGVLAAGASSSIHGGEIVGVLLVLLLCAAGLFIWVLSRGSDPHRYRTKRWGPYSYPTLVALGVNFLLSILIFATV